MNDEMRNQMMVDVFAAEEARRTDMYECAMLEQMRPSALFAKALDIQIDGDCYSVLLGPNIQEGCAGFGKSFEDAMRDFDANWHKPWRCPDKPEGT